MNMLVIPPRLISTLPMAVVKQNWRLSPTTAHVPTNLAIHGECDVDERDEDEDDDDDESDGLGDYDDIQTFCLLLGLKSFLQVSENLCSPLLPGESLFGANMSRFLDITTYLSPCYKRPSQSAHCSP